MTTSAPARKRGMTFSEQPLGVLQRTDNRAVALAEVPDTLLTKLTFIAKDRLYRTTGTRASNSAMIPGTRDTHSFIIRLIVTAPTVYPAAGLSQELRVQMNPAWRPGKDVEGRATSACGMDVLDLKCPEHFLQTATKMGSSSMSLMTPFAIGSPFTVGQVLAELHYLTYFAQQH